MTKNRFNALIAGGVAAAGVLASVGTAFALYYKAPNDGSIDISITTTSDVSLAIKNLAKTGENEFTPEHKTLEYTYNLSGVKTTNSTFTQNVVTGYLTVSVEAEGVDLSNFVEVKNKVTYAGEYYNDDARSAINLTGTGSKLEGSKITPVLIDSGNDATLTITLKDSVTDEKFAELEGVEIKTSISFVSLSDEVAKANNWVVPHVMGGIDGWGWTENDAGVMVPNIGSEKAEWMWFADQDYGESQFKVKLGDTWYGNGDSNVSATIAKGDSIYYDSTSHAVSFYHPTGN